MGQIRVDAGAASAGGPLSNDLPASPALSPTTGRSFISPFSVNSLADPRFEGSIRDFDLDRFALPSTNDPFGLTPLGLPSPNAADAFHAPFAGVPTVRLPSVSAGIEQLTPAVPGPLSIDRINRAPLSGEEGQFEFSLPGIGSLSDRTLRSLTAPTADLLRTSATFSDEEEFLLPEELRASASNPWLGGGAPPTSGADALRKALASFSPAVSTALRSPAPQVPVVPGFDLSADERVVAATAANQTSLESGRLPGADLPDVAPPVPTTSPPSGPDDMLAALKKLTPPEFVPPAGPDFLLDSLASPPATSEAGGTRAEREAADGNDVAIGGAASRAAPLPSARQITESLAGVRDAQTSDGDSTRRPLSTSPFGFDAAVQTVRRASEGTLAASAGNGDADATRLLERADALLRAGDFVTAIHAYDAALSADANSPRGLLGQGYAYLGAGEYHSSVRRITRAFEKDPRIAQPQPDLFQFFTDPEALDIRRADLEMRLAKQENHEYRFLVGYIEYFIGLTDHGLADLKHAAAAAPQGSIVARFPDLLTSSPAAHELPVLAPDGP